WAGAASVAAVDDLGCTPLHLAADWGRQSTVQYLIGQAGAASLAARDAEGRTALLRAAAAGELGTVQLLVEQAGAASVAAVDRRGRTALHLASWAWELDTVQFLLEQAGAASLTAVDARGRTALHAACSPPASSGSWVLEGQLDTVRLLVSSGASVFAAAGNGQTPLEVACSVAEVNQQVVQYLAQEMALAASPPPGAAAVFVRLPPQMALLAMSAVAAGWRAEKAEHAAYRAAEQRRRLEAQQLYVAVACQRAADGGC
ncbi:ankyrin repeat-containing domain protein, partial [Scenedesmus sp. NREL 46B-D3]